MNNADITANARRENADDNYLVIAMEARAMLKNQARIAIDNYRKADVWVATMLAERDLRHGSTAERRTA